MAIGGLNPQCIHCLLNKHLKDIPSEFSVLQKTEYMQGILKIIGNAPISMSAPEMLEQINEFKSGFGIKADFSEIKRYFNDLILTFENEFESIIEASEHPLKTAVQYAMAGNFIDFGAMENVDEAKLKATLNDAHAIDIDECEFENFQKEILAAKSIVYLIDNCGEIVLDKLLIKQILKLNRNIKITVIVRGEPVLNDCTMEDAKQVGLLEMVNVVDNGTAISGTVLSRISVEAKCIIDNADLIISKGQGNFETLQNCGRNIYYLFLCKCKMFADGFGVDQFTGIFKNEKNI